jgi:hypothetical protein
LNDPIFSGKRAPVGSHSVLIIWSSVDSGLEEVIDEYRVSHRALLSELDRMSDEELNEPARMTGLARTIPGWRPWRVLYDPRHYADHGSAIEEWLRRIQIRGPG